MKCTRSACATRSAAALTSSGMFPMSSRRQRVGAELEVVDLGLGALAAFHVERRAAAGGGPDPPALPAGGGIIDPPVHALDVDAERVGHAQGHKLAVDQCQEPFCTVAGGDRHIGAEA